ncbi:MAG: DDE-type integrase/transposase/recombinase [Pseudomonadales bacterium]|nr:DDE-type integrase/transposase/recombinase [Pseudomonadales bacterium]
MSQAAETKAPGLWRISYIDEVFVRSNGKRYYLWRAADQDSEVVDILLQSRRGNAGGMVLSTGFDECLSPV